MKYLRIFSLAGKNITLVLIFFIALSQSCDRTGRKIDERISEKYRSEATEENLKRIVRAQDALHKGNFRSALNITDSIKMEMPKFPDNNFLRGRVFTEIQNFDSARVAYERVVQTDPYYQGAWFNLGNVLMSQEQYEDAIKMYEKEFEMYPSSDVLLQLGRAYSEADNFEMAEESLLRSLEVDSTNTSAYMWLGQLYDQEGLWAEALKFSKKGLALDPSNLRYSYLVGSQLLRLQDYEEAIPYLKNVVAGSPWHTAAHYNLGQAYIGTGDQPMGRKFLDRADSLREIETRINDLKVMTETHPENLEYWVNLGKELISIGRVKEALEVYQIAAFVDPGNYSLQTDVASLTILTGDTLRGFERYNNLLEENPYHPDLWFNLGVAYANIGNFRNAEKAWEQTLQYNPEHSKAKEYLRKIRE